MEVRELDVVVLKDGRCGTVVMVEEDKSTLLLEVDDEEW